MSAAPRATTRSPPMGVARVWAVWAGCELDPGGRFRAKVICLRRLESC